VSIQLQIQTGALGSAVKRTKLCSIAEKGGNVVLFIKFPDYGRFNEIQKHKHKIKTESKSPEEAK